MSPHDPLSRAIRAAQAEASVSTLDHAATRAKVLQRTTNRTRRSRRRPFTYLIAASLVLGATWASAHANGPWEYVTTIMASAFDVGSSGSTPKAAKRSERSASTKAPAEQDRRVTVTSKPEGSTPKPLVSEGRPEVSPRPVHTQQNLPVKVPAELSVPEIQTPVRDELYLEAHRLHFHQRDYGRAVVAWNRYLSLNPSGKFVPEAIYNRAVALLHSGHTEAAEKEFIKIAGGSLGGYRKREAQTFLERINAIEQRAHSTSH